jgi:hypothetical protein
MITEMKRELLIARGSRQKYFHAVPPLELVDNPLPALPGELVAEIFAADELIQRFEQCLAVLRVH